MYHRFIAWRDGAQLRRYEGKAECADKLAEVPAALLPFWKRTAGVEFRGIPCSASFYARALEGLLVFFECVRIARAPCALPSRAADSVWHAWLAFDPGGLKRFCIRHFGQNIPHYPAGAMPGEPDKALAACLVAARRREGISPAGPWLPRLFKLDETLKMPLGYSHSVNCGRICCARLNDRGRPCEPRRFPDILTPNGLFAAYLVDAEEARFASQQRDWFRTPSNANDAGGGGGGIDCGSSSDSGGDSGGGDSGGGDGGGCGGGCGGGD